MGFFEDKSKFDGIVEFETYDGEDFMAIYLGAGTYDIYKASTSAVGAKAHLRIGRVQLKDPSKPSPRAIYAAIIQMRGEPVTD